MARRISRGWWIAAIVATLPLFALAASPVKKTEKEEAKVVELFDGIKSGDIEVKVIPKDAKEGTVTIKNKTGKPLTIKVPDALAGVPVLAQGLGAGLNGGNNIGGSPYNILTIINSGTTVPVGDASRYRAGTSFSAPLVSGVVALMLSVAPDLTATQVRDFLKASAKPFPAGSNCAPTTCGAGILDAPGAVRQALATTGAAVPVAIVEFYNAALDHYFITWVPAEIALLDAGTTIRGWTRTGKTFTVLQGAVTGTSPVCRIYIPPGKGDGHYFGRDKTECDGTMAKNPTFILEEPNFFFLYPTAAGNCATGSVPVYRVYSNRPDANHRYSIDRAVRDEMTAKGWLAEGDGPDIVAMCAPADAGARA